jgi:muramidase (phage lysozyme)
MVDYTYKLDLDEPVEMGSRFRDQRQGIGVKPKKEEPEADGWADMFYGLLKGYFGDEDEAKKALTTAPEQPSYDMDDALQTLKSVNLPSRISEPVLQGAPEKPEMGSREPFELEVDTIGNEALDRNATRLVDVTDTEKGKLSNEEALFEMGKQIREDTIKTEGLMSKRTDDSADGVQPTDGKDPTQDLLDRIAIGEGAKPELLKAQEKHGIGTTQYDMVYGFGDYAVPSKPVSEMTMKELYDYQTALINATKGKVPGTDKGTSASGKYQVTRKSLFGSGTAEKPMKNSWADKLNLKADTVYTPELQEKIAMLALKEAGYNAFIRGNKTEKAFHDRIADIWASVAKASGQDKYDQGTHTVKADLEPMYKLLKPVKTENTNRPTSPRPMLRPEEEDS